MTPAVDSTSRRAIGSNIETTAHEAIATLPASSEIQTGGIDDLMARVYVLMSDLNSQETKNGEASAMSNQAKQAEAKRQQAEALKRAKDDGGLFKWIEKDLGLGGVVGLATFNYGLVAADLAIHKLHIVDHVKLDVVDAGALATGSPELLALDVALRKTKLAPDDVKKALDKVGLGTSVPGISDKDVKPVVDKAVMANLMVAGATASVLTAGASTPALVLAIAALAASTSGTIVSMAGGPKELALALQLTGIIGAAGSGIACAASGIATTSAKVSTAAMVGDGVNASTAALQSGDTIVASMNRYSADHGQIDAQRAKQALAKLERLFDEIIDTLTDAKDSQRKTTELVASTIQTHDDTMMMAASGMKG